MPIQQQLAVSLLVLALASLGASVVGLYGGPGERAKGFWFMSGLWGFIDGAIAVSSLVQTPMPTGELRGILGINLALQAVYIPTGFVMLFRTRPTFKGFGLGILVQAVGLAAIDGYFYLICRN